jgi:orotidine-5'-phosphate decarboxylase
MSWKEKLIVALDVPHAEAALAIVDRLSDYIRVFKVGFELFVAAGPSIVREIQMRNKKVFLDLKFHDIPNTVSKAALSATRLGVHMFNIHVSGGLDMMTRCREAVDNLCARESLTRPKILGVTVLTSLNSEVLKKELGVQHATKTQVKHLAALAKRAGLDGVIASPHEISLVKQTCGSGFLVLTPGIRPSWLPPDDQKRSATPQEALREGADYIVMGRGILSQDDPIKALELISLEMLTA